MAKFDAAVEVDALEFDFTAFGGPKGTIPEPTTDTINLYYARSKEALSNFKGVRELMGTNKLEDMTEEQVQEALVKLEDIDPAELGDKMNKMSRQNVAILCGGKMNLPPEGAPEGTDPVFTGGSPTYEELELLPPRVFAAFQAWLVGELAPKKGARATKR